VYAERTPPSAENQATITALDTPGTRENGLLLNLPAKALAMKQISTRAGTYRRAIVVFVCVGDHAITLSPVAKGASRSRAKLEGVEGSRCVCTGRGGIRGRRRGCRNL